MLAWTQRKASELQLPRNWSVARIKPLVPLVPAEKETKLLSSHGPTETQYTHGLLTGTLISGVLAAVTGRTRVSLLSPKQAKPNVYTECTVCNSFCHNEQLRCAHGTGAPCRERDLDRWQA